MIYIFFKIFSKTLHVNYTQTQKVSKFDLFKKLESSFLKISQNSVDMKSPHLFSPILTPNNPYGKFILAHFNMGFMGSIGVKKIFYRDEKNNFSARVCINIFLIKGEIMQILRLLGVQKVP